MVTDKPMGQLPEAIEKIADAVDMLVGVLADGPQGDAGLEGAMSRMGSTLKSSIARLQEIGVQLDRIAEAVAQMHELLGMN